MRFDAYKVIAVVLGVAVLCGVAAAQTIQNNAPSAAGATQVIQAVGSGARRTQWATVTDSSSTVITPVGLPALSSSAPAGVTLSNVTTDTTRMLVNWQIAASTQDIAGIIGPYTVTERQWLPVFTAIVKITDYPGLGGTNGQNFPIAIGLSDRNQSAAAATGDCANDGVTVTANMAVICAYNQTSFTGSGTSWFCLTEDGGNARAVSMGVAITTGWHVFTVDLSVAGQVTCTVDGAGATTLTTHLPLSATLLGPLLDIRDTGFGNPGVINVGINSFQIIQQ